MTHSVAPTLARLKLPPATCYPARAVSDFFQFRGTDRYLTSAGLEAAVNCAIALERPLLVRGEPGTGKTVLAEAIAGGLQTRLIHWPVKSTTRAQDGLYVYDTVQRLYDSRFGDALGQPRRRLRHAAADPREPRRSRAVAPAAHVRVRQRRLTRRRPRRA